MVITSIPRFTFVLPVPVTALSHTVAIDISTRAVETILITGMASFTKAASWPYNDKNKRGKIFSKMAITKAKLTLSFTIL